jgi:hypothetical protein
MGYNTIAFLLNDHLHSLEKSPKSVAAILRNPPHAQDDELEKSMLQKHRTQMSDMYDEPYVHDQALEMLPTFHADNMKIFIAGGNQISELQVLRIGKTKDGTPTITVEAPKWLNKKGEWQYRLNFKPKR